MRNRRQSLITLTVVSAGISAFLYFTPAPTALKVGPGNQARVKLLEKNDGDAEASEVIEPLVVMDFGHFGGIVRGEFGVEMEMLPPVRLEPGMQQPSRPDAEPGQAPPMPAADKQSASRLPPIPLEDLPGIAEKDLARFDLREYLEKEKAAQPKVMPPADEE